jgi:hypothetical protein
MRGADKKDVAARPSSVGVPILTAQRHHAEYDRVVALLFPLPGLQFPSS